jgi:hypothetical protein
MPTVVDPMAAQLAAAIPAAEERYGFEFSAGRKGSSPSCRDGDNPN